MRKVFIGTAVVVASAAGVVAAAPAQAPSAVTGTIFGTTLVVQGSAGPERVLIGFRDTEVLINGVVAGPGCTGTGGLNQISCARSEFSSVRVDLGAGADELQVSGPPPENGVYGVGEGNDRVKAYTAGTFDAGNGNDTVTVAGSANSVTGGAGADTLSIFDSAATPGWRIVVDLKHNDGPVGKTNGLVAPTFERFVGGGGADVIDARQSKGGLRLAGGPGDDTLLGGRGRERFLGGETGNDTYSGGAGVDMISHSALTEGVSVSLDGKANDGRGGEADNVKPDIEIVIGTEFNDNLRARKGGSRLISGLAGADRIFGGRGRDIIDAGIGDDQIDVRGDKFKGPDTVSCDRGTDSVRADRLDRLVACDSVDRSP